MSKELILPRKFIDRSPDGRYKNLEGKPKLSYSQISSWKSPQYKPSYIKQYMFGASIPSGIFADFGSACGTYIEAIGTKNKDCHLEYAHILSESDRAILKDLDYPSDSVYEDLVVIDLGEFCIEGYIDRSYHQNQKAHVLDYKTGSIAKKKADYASLEYNQTRVYSYFKESQGYEIADCGVLLLDRAGNNSAKSPIRLTGKSEYIETPYNRAETEVFLDRDVRAIAHEISDYYQRYKKLLG